VSAASRLVSTLFELLTGWDFSIVQDKHRDESRCGILKARHIRQSALGQKGV